MKKNTYLLATDLDGTFVGDKQALHKLLRFFNESHFNPELVYITGRHLDSSLTLIKEEKLPMPNILITDVGVSIYITKDRLIEDLEWRDMHREHWHPEQIIEVASGIPSLHRQMLPTSQRVSFTIKEDTKVICKLENLLDQENIPHKLIYSSGRDVDILPKGCDKGKALTYVVNKYINKNANILVAGDSGNDRDMLQLGYPSVIVGNAEAELNRVEAHSLLYRATDSCAVGIYEAWQNFYGE